MYMRACKGIISAPYVATSKMVNYYSNCKTTCENLTDSKQLHCLPVNSDLTAIKMLNN
jgi:hypothetical protein